MADTSNLSLLLHDIRRRWRIALAVTIAVVAGVVAYAQSLPNEYQSSVVVSFAPKPGSAFGGDTLRVVLPRYIAYVTAPATTRRVAQNEGVNSTAISSALGASIGTDSGNLEIDMRTESPEEAARFANAMAAEVARFAEADPLLDAVVVAPALPNSAPVGPPRRLLAGAGIVVGALLGCAVAFMLERGRPRIRTWKDINVDHRLPRGRPDAPVPDLQVRSHRSARRPGGRRRDPHAAHQPRAVVAGAAGARPRRHVLPGGEGKTTIAASLAVTLARLDADVLLDRWRPPPPERRRHVRLLGPSKPV